MCRVGIVTTIVYIISHKFENQVVYNHSISTTMKGRLRQSGGNKESPTHTELLIQVCQQTITKDVRYCKHKFATKVLWVEARHTRRQT